MKDIEKIDKEIRRIYTLYNINFITKLGKDIYYSDIFLLDKFNIFKQIGKLRVK